MKIFILIGKPQSNNAFDKLNSRGNVTPLPQIRFTIGFMRSCVSQLKSSEALCVDTTDIVTTRVIVIVWSPDQLRTYSR